MKVDEFVEQHKRLYGKTSGFYSESMMQAISIIERQRGGVEGSRQCRDCYQRNIACVESQ